MRMPWQCLFALAGLYIPNFCSTIPWSCDNFFLDTLRNTIHCSLMTDEFHDGAAISIDKNGFVISSCWYETIASHLGANVEDMTFMIVEFFLEIVLSYRAVKVVQLVWFVDWSRHQKVALYADSPDCACMDCNCLFKFEFALCLLLLLQSLLALRLRFCRGIWLECTLFHHSKSWLIFGNSARNFFNY